MNSLNQTLPLFNLSSITREFNFGEIKVKALRGIDLAISKGDFMAIWGPSGSGKSTLLNILGLIDLPSAGNVVFEGKGIEKLSDNVLSDIRNRNIGYVFQSFNLVPVLTAWENIGLPLAIQRQPKAQIYERAMGLLDMVGLKGFGNFRPDKLSGGQRQRVAIARALVANPKLIIADEPTANLDSHTSQDIIDLLQKLNREMNVTCVFSTHDPRLLAHVPRHVCLQDGCIVTDEYKINT